MEKRGLTLVGASLILLGAFSPVMNVPLIGPVTLMQNGLHFGWVWIALAGLSVYFGLHDETERVGLVGKGTVIATVCWLLITIFRINNALDQSFASAIGGRAESILVGAAVTSLQFQWGVAVLIIGAGFLIAVGSEKRYFCPRCKGEVFSGDESCSSCDTPFRWVNDRVFLRSKQNAVKDEQG